MGESDDAAWSSAARIDASGSPASLATTPKSVDGSRLDRAIERPSTSSTVNPATLAISTIALMPSPFVPFAKSDNCEAGTPRAFASAFVFGSAFS